MAFDSLSKLHSRSIAGPILGIVALVVCWLAYRALKTQAGVAFVAGDTDKEKKLRYSAYGTMVLGWVLFFAGFALRGRSNRRIIDQYRQDYINNPSIYIGKNN